MANNAFDAMNESAGDDMYITGGAITVSEYENNMTPDDQSKYEETILANFQLAYQNDPYKKNLDFKHWLQSMNPELYRERAQKYDDIKADNNGLAKLQGMRPDLAALLEDAGTLQSLAHLHTGRIEDLVELVSNMDIEGGMQAPPQAGPGMAPPVGTSEQGVFNYEGTNKELFNELGREYKE